MADASNSPQPPPESHMHTQPIQPAFESSSRAALESAAMERVSRAPAFRRASLQARATAAVVAVFVSSMTLGTVVALYGTPDSGVLTAHAEQPDGEAGTLGPRSHLPTPPCVTKPWRCA
jgi:hypothetical protein